MVLDALEPSGTTQVEFLAFDGGLQYNIGAATPSIYGWYALWNSTTVPDGNYDLLAIGGPGASITITVNNATAVVLPANNATISGTTQYLDATATAGASNVTYELSGGPSDLSDVQIAKGALWIFGWLAAWNTTTVANGTYTLQSIASYSGGVTTTSSPITINVNNPPPSTTVVYPASGATVNNDNTDYFDGVASPGVTQVTFDLNSSDGDLTPLTATLTSIGWIGVLPAYIEGYTTCGPIGFPFSIQSVASYAGGVSGTSAPVPVTLGLYIPTECGV